ncbi:MAG: hypothetical protein CMQ31_07165 [Gammaproteobacteria bacterium]|nr:hypothetical protein [Gammaproteobacteria bacterium]
MQTRSTKDSLNLSKLFKRLPIATAVAGAITYLPAHQASAQEAEIEEITITGSRIARDGYDSPTPISILGQDELDAEVPASVAEFAMTLPSITYSTTASTSSGSLSSGNAGISSLNLRGLGTGRTLVLFDGQRNVPSSAAGLIDTNTFPQSLIERIEVASGGASSAYGSDAIAGVVNFILDRDYEGFKASIAAGEVSEYGAADQRAELTAGTAFGPGGNGHLLLSAEIFHREGIEETVADWAKDGYFAMPNPDTSPGQPRYMVREQTGLNSYTPGGLIKNGSLKGTYFGDGGSINQLNYGEVGGQWMYGGDWAYSLSSALGTNSLQAEDDRESLFSRVSWEFDDGTEVFFQASYATYEGFSAYIRPTDRNRTIYADNAYLPQQIKDSMAAAGETSFKFSTGNQDFPVSGTNNVRETSRFVFGADGQFSIGDKVVDWDAYHSRGVSRTDEHQRPTFNFRNLSLASDAVFNDSGDIVCRSTLTDAGNGCVPLNRFGVGVGSEEGIDFVMGRPRREQRFEQSVTAANFVFNDLQGWAGPIGFAVGAEYREESIKGKVDPKYASGWKYGNYKMTFGNVNVFEVYGETVVPVFEGFEFNGAARFTDYSTSGRVETWKAGFTYQPIDDITLRVTQSRDIRAPNMSELYDAGRARTNAVQVDGYSVDFTQNLTGTPTVGPEEADTLGIGLVFQPSFIPGLSFSVDYYDIDIDGVLGYLSAEQVADACFVYSRDSYCSQLRFDPLTVGNYGGDLKAAALDGSLQYIDLKWENLNMYYAEGYDFEVGYVRDVGPGTMQLRFMATNYLEDATDNGTEVIDRAGENIRGTPDWLYRGTARYDWNDWTLNLTMRGHSDGVMDNDFIECAPGTCPAWKSPAFTINENDVEGEFFYDAYLSKDINFFGGEGEVFTSVKNIFDTDPNLTAFPLWQGSENRPAYLPVNRYLMDWLGRSWRVGMRFEF